MTDIMRGPGVVGFADGKPRGVVSPTEHRLGISPITMREGVLCTSPTAAAAEGSSTRMSVTLRPAVVAIASPAGGYYLPSWVYTAEVLLSPGGSQPRIDVIAVQQHDYELGGGADSKAELVVITGTASAVPSAPAVNESQLALWEVLVPAGATTGSACTLTRVVGWAVAPGATLPVATATELARIKGTPGQRAIALDTGWVYRLNTAATSWQVIEASGAGRLEDVSWSGDITWTRSGKIITAEVAVTRLNNPFTLNAWAQGYLGRGLPGAVKTSTGTPVNSNSREHFSYLTGGVDTSGAVVIQQRWVRGTIATGWYSFIHVYIAGTQDDITVTS